MKKKRKSARTLFGIFFLFSKLHPPSLYFKRVKVATSMLFQVGYEEDADSSAKEKNYKEKKSVENVRGQKIMSHIQVASVTA